MNCVYYVNGDGQWLTLWEATGHDRHLAAWMIASSTLVFICCVIYAIQSHTATRVLSESHFARHVRDVRDVFLLFAVTQFLVSVVGWVEQLHWLVIFIRFINVWAFLKLIRSKSQILAIQKHVDGETAVARVSNAVDLIEKQRRCGLLEEISQVESVLRRAR